MECMAGIITYNPDIERLMNCIKAVLSQNLEIIINDNGSENIEQIRSTFGQMDKVFLIENNKNLGIAKALNIVFQNAYDRGKKWILTLDQDTIIPAGLIDRYCQALVTRKITPGIICPQIHDDTSDRTWPILDENEHERIVDKCITSGSLNDIETWKVIGGFDELLFIDEVDHDFCYRVRKSGKEILLVDGAVIHHQIGDTKIYKFFGMNIYVRNHSAFRKYYIARNILYIDRKQNGKITFRAFVHAAAFSLKTLVFEKEKISKFIACCRGMHDGISNNMR